MSFEETDLAMQPLHLVKDILETNWGTGYGSPLTMRPKLAVKIAEYITHWSEIEIMLGVFLAFLLHANEKAILAMYSEAGNRAAQLRMISSAAAAILPQNHADVVSVFMTAFIKPTMKMRDRFAHWCWGFSDELPDALLIRDPAINLNAFAVAIREQGLTKREVAQVPTDHTSIFVITDPDLDRILKQMSAMELNFRRLMASVWELNTPQERDEQFQLLSSVPEIQAGLVRLRKNHRKTQDTPPESPSPDQSGGS